MSERKPIVEVFYPSQAPHLREIAEQMRSRIARELDGALGQDPARLVIAARNRAVAEWENEAFRRFLRKVLTAGADCACEVHGSIPLPQEKLSQAVARVVRTDFPSR